MRSTAPIGITTVLLACVVGIAGAGCRDDQPERDFSRPPEYRNQAAEFLLSQQARKSEDDKQKILARKRERAARRARLKAVRAEEAQAALSGVPAGFPAAFVAFPGAEFEMGFELTDTSMVSLRVPGGSASDIYARAKAAADESGWRLEIEADEAGQQQASFRKVAHRVELRVNPHPNGGAKVIAILQDLEPPLPE